MKVKKVAKQFLLTAFLFAGSTLTFASGFSLYNEGSAEAVGLGGALVGRTDLLSNAWYNPAALKEVDSLQIMLGASAINLNIDYDEPGYSSSLQDKWRVAPHSFMAMPLGEDFVLSLSLTSPYGMITEWGTGWNYSYVATETNLQTFYISPALTWKATDKLALAVGVNVVRSEVLLKRTDIPVVHPTYGYLGTTDMELSADEWDVGGMVAFHYTINDDWAIGGKYQSKVEINFDDAVAHFNNANLNPAAYALFQKSNVDGRVTLPASLTLGVANTSLEKWTFAFDVVWTQWSSYKQMKFNFDDLPGTAGVPGSSAAPKNWDDVFSYHLSAEYQVNENWALRCGYIYDESPAPDDTIGPEMPDGDRHLLSLGVGYKAENWGVDLAYMYIFVDRRDAGSTTGMSGEYSSFCQILSASFTYEF